MKAILEWKSPDLPIDLNYVKEYFALSEDVGFIKKLLGNAIEHIELENGVSLRKKIWKIVHDNNFVVLAFAPITKLIAMVDGANKKVEPLVVKRASDSLTLQFASSVSVVKVTYEVGYDADALPECLKNSVLEKFWDLYLENVSDVQYHYVNRVNEVSNAASCYFKS